ncbi:MAG: hypothetical protein AB7F59_01700 [Bdellovibrionales bacterium]
MADNTAKKDLELVEGEETEEHFEEEMVSDGNPDSLGNAIVQFTTAEKYDRAIRELRAYQEYKANYPTYADRTDRLFEHIENVINAIRSKKNLTRAVNISASKRKEISQVVGHHIKQLKGSLQRVVQIEQQLRMKDSRSTIWVVKAMFLSCFAIGGIALFMEAYEHMQVSYELLLQHLESIIARLLNL